MSDDDLIRRGDAKAVAQKQFLPSTIGGDLICDPEQGECTANAIDRIPAAPSALGAAAMRERAASVPYDPKYGTDWLGMSAAILAIPLPDEAALTADALRLPKIKALVEAAEDAEYDLLQWLECAEELVKAGFNMDGTAPTVAKLTAALRAFEADHG